MVNSTLIYPLGAAKGGAGGEEAAMALQQDKRSQVSGKKSCKQPKTEGGSEAFRF